MTYDPKIELHLHLEGAAPPDFIRRLGQEKKISLDRVFDEQGSYVYSDFQGFLKVYEAATAVLKSPEDFARLTRAVLEQSRDQGVIYTEVFVCPDFCGGRDVIAWREYLQAIEEAAAAVDGIAMRTIATCIRHLGPDKARQSALCAAETAGAFVTGFGMAGDERAGAAKDFAWAFDCAREAGLGLTAHAGEFGGPTSVRETLDHLRVSRIGHGVRAIEDPDLVERLAREGILLEVCPGSNIALGVYTNFALHPIEKLMSEGVNISVSTDDPPFFHTTMNDEYAALHRHFGWESDHFRVVNQMAARAAFCDDETRADLLKKLET